MELREATETYLQMLNESLQQKLVILNKIYELTKKQDQCFGDEDEVIPMMEYCVEAKEPLLEQLSKLDQGFDLVYSKIKGQVSENINKHKTEVEKLQTSISEITSLSVKIQALEQSNKIKFETYLNCKKTEIKQFKVNNKTASNYYKSMTGKHQGESYFIDKKK